VNYKYSIAVILLVLPSSIPLSNILPTNTGLSIELRGN